jgi:hypothetical protein
MLIVKITNLKNSNDIIDYKGLNLDLIVAGSQLYPPDENTAYFFYDGEVIEGEDLQLITESEYQTVKTKSEGVLHDQMDYLVDIDFRLSMIELGII